MCSKQDKGPVAMKACTTSCIACGMCERTCKFDAIHVVDGVARIDYDKCKGCGMCAQKCPKHIILFPLKDDPNPVSYTHLGRHPEHCDESGLRRLQRRNHLLHRTVCCHQ